MTIDLHDIYEFKRDGKAVKIITFTPFKCEQCNRLSLGWVVRNDVTVCESCYVKGNV